MRPPGPRRPWTWTAWVKNVIEVSDVSTTTESTGIGASCVGDLDGDSAVTVLDVLELLAHWGPCP